MGSIPLSPTTISQLQPNVMPLISPSALLSAHLSQSPPRRSSGRLPTQSRPVSLNTASLTHAHGSSIVKIGNGTTVVCGVRGEILPISAIPSWSVKDPITRTTEEWEAAEAADETVDTETKYWRRLAIKDEVENEDPLWQHSLLVANISLDTGCSPLHPANTAPSVEQQSLSQRLLSLLLSSKLVRLHDLEIYQYHRDNPATGSDAGADDDTMQLDDGLATSSPRSIKAFWTLYIDIMCISHAGSGSVFDAAWLALSAALQTTVLPHAEWDADLGRVVCFDPSTSSDSVGGNGGERKPRRLRLRGTPVPLSWGVFVPDKRVSAATAASGEKDTKQEEPAAARPQTTTTLLIDLDTAEEEACSEQGCVVVDLNDDNQETTLLRLEKSGGSAVGVDEVQQVVKAAEGRWREWMGLIKALG